MPTLTRRDGLHVLDLGDDENRFSPPWLTAVEDALDKVMAALAPLITVGSGKFYSNGLDLDWLSANVSALASYTSRIEGLLARVLTLPVPTVASVNGHAFGGGAMLALAHDWRVMREDRGYFCFPEVDIAIPFTAGLSALIQNKLTPRQALDAMTTGHRYAGPEAAGGGLIDATATKPSCSRSRPRWLPISPASPPKRWARSRTPCTPTSYAGSPRTHHDPRPQDRRGACIAAHHPSRKGSNVHG